MKRSDARRKKVFMWKKWILSLMTCSSFFELDVTDSKRFVVVSSKDLKKMPPPHTHALVSEQQTRLIIGCSLIILTKKINDGQTQWRESRIVTFIIPLIYDDDDDDGDQRMGYFRFWWWVSGVHTHKQGKQGSLQRGIILRWKTFTKYKNSIPRKRVEDS